MATVQPQQGYSTTVRIRLEVNGTTLRVAQVGGDSLILRDSADVPADSHGTLVLAINGREQAFPIRLVDGIQSSNKVVRFC